MKEDKKIENI